MKRMLKAAAALLLGTSMLVTGAAAAAPNFTDVPSGHWAYTYVSEAAENNLVSGKGGGLYGVNDALNIGEFATMICGLLYPEADDPYAGKSSYWWYQYAEAAYQKGDLAGTVAGDRRTADGAWTATVVQQPMSRYDLAQIIANVMESQGWPTPDATLIFLAMATIPDWSDIPTNYQNAVAMAYAGGFLSGMEGGRFDGESSMTRGQAAVVLCAMLDAKTEQDAPVYTNRSGRLVNGEEANEDNVREALSDLKSEFYNYYLYDVDRSYTSQRLGTASGEQGFAYMISDRVFGALAVEEQDDPDRLKPGDLVDLDGEYQVVTDVSGNSYDYVTCDSMGIVYWRTDGDVDEINTRYDTIWTRYEGEDPDALANGEEATERNVKDILDDLDDDYYEDRWREDDYESNVFGGSNGYSESFAYFISDEIFGSLDYNRLNPDDSDIWLDDIRVGDMVQLAEEDDNDETVYGIVLAVDENSSSNQIKILFAEYNSSKDDYYIEEDWIAFDELYWIYTRYPEDVSSWDEDDIDAQLDDLWDKYRNKIWDENDYDSDSLGNSNGYSESFAYFISDELFGDEPYEDLYPDDDDIQIDELRLGDVVYLLDTDEDREDIYGVVIEVEPDAKNSDDRAIRILLAEYQDDDEYQVAKMYIAFNDIYCVYTRY